MPIVELRQDRALVNTTFDGYKLSLDPVPVLRQELKTSPLKLEASSDQYSLLHAELFSMQNLLQADPWARNISYFVNRQHEIVCSRYDEKFGRAQLQFQFRVDQSASEEPRRDGDYNYSMRFISENWCLLCDGINTVYLLHTGDRLKAAEWKIVSQTSIDVKSELRGFLLYDARLDIIEEHKQISLALGHVARTKNDQGGCQHYMQIYWARWQQETEGWRFEICETLEGKGSIYYCAFEPRGQSLIVCSNRKLLMLAQRQVIEAEAENVNKSAAKALANTTGTDTIYSWIQNDEDIVLKFPLPPGGERSDYNIKATKQTLEVYYADNKLLDDTLYGEIDNDLTTWTIEDSHLQILLVKQEASVSWPSLLLNGSEAKKESSESMPLERQPIVNLETPIEDCDLLMDVPDGDEVLLERFNLPLKQATHTVLLGSTKPLFSTTLRPGFPPALVTRQDVDASLWLQHYYPSKPLEWNLRHEGNLHAFAYVQASKQQKKFTDCAPDMSYAVICESYRHIFLYKSRHDTANGLRKRNGPQVSIGKQHMVTLDEQVGEVLGMSTALGVVTVLTESFILHLQIE